ncbi:hypothetical protein TWF718_007677 [Orbilia javanica]|uniref:LysM domain-containing protein n=1 Tax=Orbilia javanica TaxID=47235 RepID=A0AAN8MZW5_9PEZI
MRSITLLGVLCASKAVLAQVNLYWDDFTEKDASIACNNALFAAISSCPDELALKPNSQDFKESVLTFLCSTACGNSLSAYANNVQGDWCAKSTSEVTPAPTGIAAYCKECLLKNQQAILNSEFGYQDFLDTDFSAIKSNYSVTGYLITIPTPANNLEEGCGNFPTSSTLYLPDIRQYDIYWVKAGDICNSVAYGLNQGVTAVILQSWNPGINHWCRNFDSGYFVGQDICVSNPYGTFTIPDVTDPGTSQISTASTVVPIPTSLAPDVNTRCGRYYQVSLGDNCNLVVQRNGISMEDFIFLNPMINSNCTNLWAGYNYCILPVGTITTYSGHPLSIETNTAPSTTFNWDTLATTTDEAISTETLMPLANGTRLDCAYYFGSSEYSKRCEDVAA